MKEYSGKNVLIVKVAQNDPLDSSSQKKKNRRTADQGHGVVLHVQEEVYQLTLTFTKSVLGTKNDALDPFSKKF